MSTHNQSFSKVRTMRLEELYQEFHEVERQLTVIHNRGMKPEEEEEVHFLAAWRTTLQNEIWHLRRIRDKIPTREEFYAMSKEEQEPWICCKCNEPALVEAPNPGVYCSASCAVKAYY